ncbi:unnamed protein product [Protopolystoma xenopodis]|uniref:Uncharacterized protein n=1 Tax=Protopolystoma xenopodis TaxID=117903 RepID=A0A3S5CEL6_9PLAT|nr:unnamed protein product [Protopolystoma xenopodis]
MENTNGPVTKCGSMGTGDEEVRRNWRKPRVEPRGSEPGTRALDLGTRGPAMGASGGGGDGWLTGLDRRLGCERASNLANE